MILYDQNASADSEMSTAIPVCSYILYFTNNQVVSVPLALKRVRSAVATNVLAFSFLHSDTAIYQTRKFLLTDHRRNIGQL